MVHELKKILQGYLQAQKKNQKAVMATLVNLDGSSYRRPGVRMLVVEDGQMIGAVSGGCVEKEILKQSLTVFSTGEAKMITYDGRYRLGCDGILYILIEPFQPDEKFLKAFDQSITDRSMICIKSQYVKNVESNNHIGSFLYVKAEKYYFRKQHEIGSDTISDIHVFEHEMNPCFRLVIIGAEHDAIKLCDFAAKLGWEVVVVTGVSDPQSISDFPGAYNFLQVEPEQLSMPWLKVQDAIVLMTHSYVRDLKYLIALKDQQPIYIGLLGPARRREKLLNELVEHAPMVEEDFFDRIYGPAGLNIGAETAEEIAISICSEILSVVRKETPSSLKTKSGSIHCNWSE